MLNYSLLTIVIAASSIFFGCTKPSTRSTSPDGSFNVYLDAKDSRAFYPKADPSASWFAPREAIFEFQACFKDKITLAEIRNPTFAITKLENNEVIGDIKVIPNKPCLSWRETFPFNYFAGKSAWVTLNRRFVGTGLHTGTQDLSIGVNPWAIGSTKRDEGPILNLTENPRSDERVRPPAETLQFLQSGPESASELYVDEIEQKVIRESDFFAGPEQKGQALLLEISMEPKRRFVDSEGISRVEKIHRGDLDISIQYLAANAGPKSETRLLLLTNTATSSGKIRDGKVKFEIRVLNTARVNQGNLEFMMKLAPRGGISSIREFHGIFRIGTGAQIRSGSGKIANDCITEVQSSAQTVNRCNFDHVVSTALNAAEYKNWQESDKDKLKGYVHSNDPYIFSTLRLRYTRVLPGETATQRSVAYSASTCITDRFSGERLADTPFVIKYTHVDEGQSPKKDIPVTTDESGCLNWSSNISHKYYKPENFFKFIISIERPSGYKRELTYYLNPWDDKFTFGFDEREFTKSFFEEIRRRDKIESRFFLSNFKYHTLRFLYGIDRFMELEVKKTVLLELHPMVLRYSGIIAARKSIEPLRDGIYLMKIAIQKNYLDPADRAGYYLTSSRDDNNHLRAKIEKVGNIEIPARDFVTTRSLVVRVVDGMIIQPVELSMSDLRLMRIRSNFLVQLEPVDERLVQAYPLLTQHVYKDDLELRRKLKELQELEFQDQANPESKAKVAEIEEKIRQTRAVRDSMLSKLARSINNKADIINDTFGADEDLGKHLKSLFGLAETQAQQLKEVLGTNDFTKVTLPKSDKLNLDLLIEKDAGLEKRTFVGPVVYLSNSWSDSMRATDNLDEANCTNKRDASKPDEWAKEEWEALNKVEGQMNGHRQNKAYEANSYFGALSHLCDRPNVDDWIKRETDNRKKSIAALTAVSTKHNFAQFFELDYVSIKGSPLMKQRANCTDHADQCWEPTLEHTLDRRDVVRLVNHHWQSQAFWANWGPSALTEWAFGKDSGKIRQTPWTENDLGELFFGQTRQSQLAQCALFASKIADRVREHPQLFHHVNRLTGYLISKCPEGSIIRDTKLHVRKTGSYTYEGGQQLNINVGENISFSESESNSGSFNIVDTISVIGKAIAPAIGLALGGAPGLAAGAAVGETVFGGFLKPFSISRGQSRSNTNGTGMSHSTYLVSQIAGFMLDIEEYERCMVLRLDPEYLKHVVSLPQDRKNLKQLASVLRAGIFACEDEIQTAPRRVEETYYYFTQHFTEGDMLDQADIYNHPWLLPMRGVRDFADFTQRINAQEIASPDFLSLIKGTPGFENLTGLRAGKTRPITWPLAHMTEVYRKILPTFPGFYTVIEQNESTTQFPLNFRLQKRDRDSLGEIRTKRSPPP